MESGAGAWPVAAEPGDLMALYCAGPPSHRLLGPAVLIDAAALREGRELWG